MLPFGPLCRWLNLKIKLLISCLELFLKKKKKSCLELFESLINLVQYFAAETSSSRKPSISEINEQSHPLQGQKKQYLKIKYHPLIPSLVNEKNEPKISFLTFFSSFHILGFVCLLRWVLSSNKFLVFRTLYAQGHEWGLANKSDICLFCQCFIGLLC